MCKKPTLVEPKTEYGKLTLTISHFANQLPLIFDTMQYENKSGSTYSVSRIQYYLSQFIFKDAEGKIITVEKCLYVDGKNEETLIQELSVPLGDYNSIGFLVGVAPAQNFTGGLENTLDNQNMSWPDVIGGGYHFLKFEGLYLDTLQNKKGFVMHLGDKGYQVTHDWLNYPIQISKEEEFKIALSMNMNGWFESPYTYNFNKDGNYTMAIPELMQILKLNGHDIFTIK
jgi:hypothetical protein